MHGYDYDDFLDDMDSGDKVCGTCAHWAHEQLRTMVVRSDYGRREYDVAPCLQEAVEADAGPDSLVLLGARSHCRMHADCYAPDAAYLYERGSSPHIYNGVTPGLDFPDSLGGGGTLSMERDISQLEQEDFGPRLDYDWADPDYPGLTPGLLWSDPEDLYSSRYPL